jgi:hypothetical protein
MTILRSPGFMTSRGRRAGWTTARMTSAVIGLLPVPGAGPVFAGIAPASAASHYLAGVGYNTVRRVTHHHPVYIRHIGGASASVPARAGIWAANAAGPGTQTLTWPDGGGSWSVAVMTPTGHVRWPCASASPRRCRPCPGSRPGCWPAGSSCWPQAWLSALFPHVAQPAIAPKTWPMTDRSCTCSGTATTGGRGYDAAEFGGRVEPGQVGAPGLHLVPGPAGPLEHGRLVFP